MAAESNSVYHYTSAEAGLQIVETMRFRLGAFERLNDLREARQSFPSLSSPDGPMEGERFMQLYAQLDLWMRRYLRVGCFTRDFASDPTRLPLDPNAARGWSHPALWAHYGKNHSGVCLEFDRPRLIETFSSQLSGRGRLLTGDVTYDTYAWPIVAGLNYHDIAEYGVDAATWAYLYKDRDFLLFNKHADWQNEHEFRLVCLGLDEGTVELDVAGCLTGIFFGDAFDRQLAAEARRVTDLHSAVETRTLHHFNRSFFIADSPPTSERAAAFPVEVGEPFLARHGGSLEERVKSLEASTAVNDVP